MQMQFSIYHSTLRVSATVCALVLLFDSGLLSTTTARLSDSAQLYLANAVGVSVGVPENDVNRLTARISELEQEAAVRERTIAVNLDQGTRSSSTSTFILSGILFILIVLIVLNYALDYARARDRLLVQG